MFKEARMINRGRILEGDLWVRDGRIVKVDPSIALQQQTTEIRIAGKYIMPGIIDDQVHFREPGMEYKATISSESAAAVAGGVTSFMEMPNTKPPAVTQALLEEKYKIASKTSWANYSFFMGATNDNLQEVLKTDPEQVCGVKVFMGSSTGNMLVDDIATLEQLFASCPTLIAAHCEDESTIRSNMAEAESRYGSLIPPSAHPWIRSREACLLSSKRAVALAKKHNTRFHVLHISTKDELGLFEKGWVGDKRITSEACAHYMFFSSQDYLTLGNQIKCNPAIKTAEDQHAILQAVVDDVIDIIASDHAPHTWEEKGMPYKAAPSGLPLVQHTFQMMLTHWCAGRITLEKIIEKMCHAPAACFRLEERGYLDEGYYADLVQFDPDVENTITKDGLFYKCGWSPLEGKTMPGQILGTWVSGIQVFGVDGLVGGPSGMRLRFRV